MSPIITSSRTRNRRAQDSASQNGVSQNGYHPEQAETLAQPTIPQVNAGGIPEELKERRQWIGWRYELVGGKWTKVPHQRTGRKASTTNPDTWNSVANILYKHQHDPRFGVGFVFAEDDPYVGVDLDDCIDEDGVVHQSAQSVIDQLDSFTETSPSGTGVHVFIRGAIGGSGVKVKGGWGGNFETYAQGRYFACTGDVVNDVSPQARQDELDRVRLAVKRGAEVNGETEATESAGVKETLGDQIFHDFNEHRSEGEDRGELLCRVTPLLRQMDLDPEESLDLLKAYNKEHCHPPKPDANVEEIHRRYVQDYAATRREEKAQEHAREEDEDRRPPLPEYPYGALPSSMRALVEQTDKAGGAGVLMAGAALAAAAAAIGDRSEVRLGGDWVRRAILWVPLIAPPGTGKSSVISRAFAPIHEIYAEERAEWRVAMAEWEALDAEEQKNTDKPPAPAPRVLGNLTFEGVLDLLQERNAAVAPDELATFLDSLGQYKGGRGTDRAVLTELWGGLAMTVTRVTKRIYLPRPTVAITGGLQPCFLDKLGDSESGLRDRWLPHVVEHPAPVRSIKEMHTPEWRDALAQWRDVLRTLVHEERDLTEDDEVERWTLSLTAEPLFDELRDRWYRESRDEGAFPAVAGILAKTAGHAAGVALVFAKLRALEEPNPTREIDVQTLQDAASIVDYCVNVWRSQDASDSTAFTSRDQHVEALVHKLRARVRQQPEQRLNKRQARRSHSFGATPDEWKAVLKRYTEQYPGCVTDREILREPPR